MAWNIQPVPVFPKELEIEAASIRNSDVDYAVGLKNPFNLTHGHLRIREMFQNMIKADHIK